MSADKKWPLAKGAGQQPARPTTPTRPTPHAHRFKPAVAQSKNTLAVPHRRLPVAPPVYSPRAKPAAAQAKAATLTGMKMRPSAPPVYRPQATPKVLQTKTALSPQPHAAQPKTAAAYGATRTPWGPRGGNALPDRRTAVSGQGVVQRHLYKGFIQQNEGDLKGLMAQSPLQAVELKTAYDDPHRNYDVRGATAPFELVEVVFRENRRGTSIRDVARAKASRPGDMKALRTVPDAPDSRFQQLIHAAASAIASETIATRPHGMGLTPVVTRTPPRVKHEHTTIFRRATSYTSATRYVRDTIGDRGLRLGIDVNELDFQILHGVGHSQGGRRTQDAKNLAAASSGANTEMIPFDAAVTGNSRISIETTFRVIPRTQIALEIEMNYYLTLEDGRRELIFQRVIQGFRTPVTRSEYEGYESRAEMLKPANLEAAEAMTHLWQPRLSRDRSVSPPRRSRSRERAASVRLDSDSPRRDRSRSRSRSRDRGRDELSQTLNNAFQIGDAVARQRAAAVASSPSPSGSPSSTPPPSLPPPPLLPPPPPSASVTPPPSAFATLLSSFAAPTMPPSFAPASVSPPASGSPAKVSGSGDEKKSPGHGMDWIRANFIVGEASGSGNNCLLYTIYKLTNAAPYPGMEEAVGIIRGTLIAARFADTGAMIDLYGGAGVQLAAALRVRIRAYEVRGDRVIVHPDIGVIGEVIHILHNGNHFSPLAPRR